MVHMCIVIISPGAFFIFSKFWFYRSLERQKGKKWLKMTQTFVHCTSYHRNYISYHDHLRYTCVKWYLQVLFYFFKIFIFHLVTGVKEQKNSPKWKKNSVCCTPYLRNHTSYNCHGTHMWNDICFFCFCFVFTKFWFSRSLEVVRGQKMTRNKKFCQSPEPSFMNVIFV